MTRLDNAIELKVPREEVFAYVANVGAQPEWVKWAKSVELTGTAAGGVGATDAMLMQVGPHKSNVEGLISERKEGYFLRRRLTKGMDLTESLSLVNFGEGTKLAWTLEYTPPMGGMGRMIDLLFMVRLFDQLMKDSLANLKEILEAKP